MPVQAYVLSAYPWTEHEFTTKLQLALSRKANMPLTFRALAQVALCGECHTTVPLHKHPLAAVRIQGDDLRLRRGPVPGVGGFPFPRRAADLVHRVHLLRAPGEALGSGQPQPQPQPSGSAAGPSYTGTALEP